MVANHKISKKKCRARGVVDDLRHTAKKKKKERMDALRALPLRRARDGPRGEEGPRPFVNEDDFYGNAQSALAGVGRALRAAECRSLDSDSSVSPDPI